MLYIGGKINPDPVPFYSKTIVAKRKDKDNLHNFYLLICIARRADSPQWILFSCANHGLAFGYAEVGPETSQKEELNGFPWVEWRNLSF